MDAIGELFATALPTLQKAVFSAPLNKGEGVPSKIVLERRGDIFFAEEFRGGKAFHEKVPAEATGDFAERCMARGRFRQMNLFSKEKETFVRISKNGRVTQKSHALATPLPERVSHNREKHYLICEGDPIPFLVDLGIFTKDYKVVRSMYDKFRQINRFVELLDDAFSKEEKEEISVIDFGCGKSYLTFLIYYYFTAIKKVRVTICGYDLKEDVVDHCNTLAARYGYHGMRFFCRDIVKNPVKSLGVDFVVSLHACDTATDFALHFALENRIPHIFSVPCCQHEIAQTIHRGGDFDLLLSHGLFRERFSALLTDAIRAEILRREGYRVDVMEFVDFAHSPKNVMLRAHKTTKARRDLTDLLALEETYGFHQTLLHLREEKQ